MPDGAVVLALELIFSGKTPATAFLCPSPPFDCVSSLVQYIRWVKMLWSSYLRLPFFECVTSVHGGVVKEPLYVAKDGVAGSRS